MMASFYYYDQNPLGFCFLVQIRAFVIQSSPGLPNLDMKGKTKRDRCMRNKVLTVLSSAKSGVVF